MGETALVQIMTGQREIIPGLMLVLFTVTVDLVVDFFLIIFLSFIDRMMYLSLQMYCTI